MFGKPEWFRKKSVGWGVRPVTWKGWLYGVLWAGVICIPFIALLAHAKVLESLIWVVVMMFAMLWDVQGVMREMDIPTAEIDEDLLVIDEDTEPDPAYFATRSYDLHVPR